MEIKSDIADEIAALNALPAGGVASAYTALMGIGLIYKVLLFELNRNELNTVSQANYREAQREIERLFFALRKIIREEPQCYVNFRGSHSSGDRAEGKSAFLDVLTCSMSVMEKTMEGLEWVAKLGKVTTPLLKTNLRVAAELLGAAHLGTAHIIRQNIQPIKSDEKRQSYISNLESVLRTGIEKRDEALAAVTM